MTDDFGLNLEQKRPFITVEITGAAGVGKTRLASMIAGTIFDRETESVEVIELEENQTAKPKDTTEILILVRNRHPQRR